jgi:hypothetical protein
MEAGEGGEGGEDRPVCESFCFHVSIIIPLMRKVHSSIIRGDKQWTW